MAVPASAIFTSPGSRRARPQRERPFYLFVGFLQNGKIIIPVALSVGFEPTSRAFRAITPLQGARLCLLSYDSIFR